MVKVFKKSYHQDLVLFKERNKKIYYVCLIFFAIILPLILGDFLLGEMALLDDEPRSADATITEESTLFKIEREGFYEVMAGQSVIMQGIIKLLTGRLRVANEKLMSK